MNHPIQLNLAVEQHQIGPVLVGTLTAGGETTDISILLGQATLPDIELAFLTAQFGAIAQAILAQVKQGLTQ